MTKKHAAFCLALLSMTIGQAEVIVSSPDGRINVDFEMKEGRPTYSVLYDGQVAIEPSVLGLKTNMGDYTQNLKWDKEKLMTGENIGSYILPSLKVGQEHKYQFKTAKLQFSRNANPAAQGNNRPRSRINA